MAGKTIQVLPGATGPNGRIYTSACVRMAASRAVQRNGPTRKLQCERHQAMCAWAVKISFRRFRLFVGVELLDRYGDYR